MPTFRTAWAPNSTSGTLTIAPTAGDLLIAWAITDATGTSYPVPTGWVQIGSTMSTSAVDSGSTSIFWKWADGTETSIYFASTALGGCAAWSGVNPTTPFDVTPVLLANDSGATSVDMSIDPTTGGCTIVFLLGVDGPSGDATFAWSTVSGTTGSWTPRVDQGTGFYNFGMADCSQTDAGAVTARCEINQTASRPAAIIALRPSGTAYAEPLSDSVATDESMAGNLGAGSVGLYDTTNIAEHGGVTAPFCQRDFVQVNFGQMFPPGGGGQTYAEPVSETVTGTEQASAQDHAIQGVYDSHTAGDSIGSAGTATAGLSDTGAVGDGTITGDRTAFGTVGETVTDADDIGTVATAIQSLNDSVSVVENLAVQGKSIQEIVEATGITEAQTIGILLSAALADSVSKVEGIGAVASAIQALNEAIGVGDSLGAGVNTNQALNDSTGVGDGLGAVAQASQTVSDSVAEGDGLDASANTSQGLNDSAGISENVSTGGSTVHTIGLEDSGSAVEALAAAYSVVQTVTDSHGLTEVQATQLTSTLGLAESIAKSEGFTGSLQIALTLAEAVTNAESLLASKITTQELADSLAITEQQVAGILLAAALAEAVAHADGIASVVTALAGLSDTGSFGDGISVGGSTTYSENLTETTGLSEGAVAALKSITGLNDSGSIAEAVGYALTMVGAVSEQYSLTEAQTQKLSTTLEVVEQLVGSDGVTAASRLVETISEQCSLAEAAANTSRASANVEESAGLADALASLASVRSQIEDAVTAVEEATVSHRRDLSLEDALGLADAAETVRTVYTTVTESVAFGEDTTAAGGTEYAAGQSPVFDVSATDPNLLLFVNSTAGNLIFFADAADGNLLFQTSRA